MFPMLLAVALLANGNPALDLAESVITRAEMHERFTRATMVQTALINGNLESAQHWARQLAAISPDPDGFGDLRARFGDLALAVAHADTLAEATRRTASMANACGACHELHDVSSNRFESEFAVPGGETMEQRMARHIWAADRLWEGLVGRSESAWANGATVLMEAPLTPREMQIEAPAAEAFANQVKVLGKAAYETARWSDRAAVYGEFLATCAACHQAYRVEQ